MAVHLAMTGILPGSIQPIFQHIEKCIQALMNLGIEADLIVMHPYDRWGFSMMKAEDDDCYWKYVLARFFPHTEMYGGPWLMSMI